MKNKNKEKDIRHKAVEYGTCDIQQIVVIDRKIKEGIQKERQRICEELEGVVKFSATNFDEYFGKIIDEQFEKEKTYNHGKEIKKKSIVSQQVKDVLLDPITKAIQKINEQGL